MPKLARFFLWVFLLLQRAGAQPPLLADTSSATGIASALVVFNQSLDQTDILYNGREYFRYPPGIDGHGYLGINDWQPCQVAYGGLHFAQVAALYDMVKDELVIRHFSGMRSVQLVKEQVSRFSFGTQHFVRIDGDSSGAMTPGFYEVLYDGRSQVLARRTKSIVERVGADRIESKFVQKNRYFVRVNHRVAPVNKEEDLLALMGSQRKAIQQYLRKNKLRFRKEQEQTLIQATAQYDASTN